MKINYALMGSTDDLHYLDFWPVVSKVWKEIFNIIPVLGLVTNGQEIKVNNDYGMVFKLPQINGYSNGYLSQFARIYLPKFLKGNCIVTDIDMIPLSKKYFIDDLENYSDDDFIVMSSHHPQTIGINQYPMCYVAGSDYIFNELFDLNITWEEFIEKIPNLGWFSDQMHLYNMISTNKQINYEFPFRKGNFINDRIDRESWSYEREKLLLGEYIDCHSLRPYYKYKDEIDKLINILYEIK